MTDAIACGDVTPGCEGHFGVDSEDDLVEQVAAHAGADHGAAEVTPGVGAAVERAIRQT